MDDEVAQVLAGTRQWAVVEGDARQLMPALPDGCVGAVVTDPPYGTGAWLRTASGQGRDRTIRHKQESWDIWSTDWLLDAERVGGGRLGLFAAQVNLPSLFGWAGERKWRLFFWGKTDPQPRFDGKPANSFECFVVVGAVRAVAGMDYHLASSVRERRDPEAVGHPHQKRASVMAWALGLCCDPGDVVLDPFCGSGTTLLACLMTGRRGIGFEIDPAHCATARRRLEEASNQTGLFAALPRTPDLFRTTAVEDGVSPE
jgi:DNA modification methylase